MTMIEIGALASALLALITLTGKIVTLITTVQRLISSIDRLQVESVTNTERWEKTTKNYENLKQRLSLIEYELAMV